jgi:hypothetical protein
LLHLVGYYNTAPFLSFRLASVESIKSLRLQKTNRKLIKRGDLPFERFVLIYMQILLRKKLIFADFQILGEGLDLAIIWTAATVPLGGRGAYLGRMSQFQPRVFQSRRQKALPNWGGGVKLDFYESILLTTDNIHEKLQTCKYKLLNILRSVDMAATSRAVLSVLLISNRCRLGSQMTWSVLGPFTCFLICRAMELSVASVLI